MYGPSSAARSSARTNVATTASGVGNETWKRTPAGIAPSSRRRAKIAYEERAASA
ncbi:hypothetical protein GCM10027268_24150 [Brachybacterium huguangmaarense]